MKRKITFLLAALLLMSGLTWAQTTLNIGDYASANNWTNGTQYLTAMVDDVTFTAAGGGNTGKYYSSDQSWRFYANENATLTISVPSGNSLVSVIPTFTIKDNGILLFGGETIASGTTVSVSGEEVVFNFSQSSGNKGKVFFTEIEVTYTSGGTPIPSITAANVEIAYDATSGAIEYTINNPAGGTLDAATESDWLTLGSVGTTVPFTCTANATTTARTATVTLTYTYNTDQTVTKNVTVTQTGDPNAVNNISDITATGTYTVQGTIVAKSQRGFIVGDGTGYVYYYNQNYTQADYNIGDMVKLTGSVVVYGGVFEFNNSTTITAATSSNYVAEDPTVITGEQMDARVASTTPPQLSNYVQYEGTMTVNDGHYNITNIIGATTAIGSISYPLNVDEITALDGKHVKVTGYYVGISTSTYYNTMLGNIEEIATSNPSIAAEDVSIEYNATTGAIAYTINNPVSGGVLTAATESEWLTMGAVGTTVPFTCTANTTASPRTATVILTYTYNTDQIVTKNVTVTQAGNPNTIDNISDITAAGTYTVQGTIVAISDRGFILGDGTGYVYYYYGSSGFEPGNYDIGDNVKLAGSVIVYGGVYEFNNTTTITYVDESNYVSEDPAVLSGADMDARVASTTPAQLSSYVQYEGTFSVSNGHYNITNIDSAQTAIGSISYPIDTTGFNSLNGKQVKVTGYYVGISSSKYYNTMIGSIEEVEVQHEQYTLTVSNLMNVNTFVFDAANQNEMLLEGEGSALIYNGTGVIISVDVEEGYALQSLMVDGVDVTSQIDETGVYTFTMPSHNVTVTATAVEQIVPSDGDYVRISSLDQLKDGSIVVIAARYDTIATNYFAMKNTIGNKIQGTEFVSQTSGNDEVLASTIVDDINNYYWVVNVTADGYTFTNANGDKIGYGNSTNFATNGEKTTWSVESGTSGAALVPYYAGFTITNTTTTDRGIALRDNDGNKVFGAYSTQNINGDNYNFFLDFFVQTEASETPTQTVALTAGTNWFSTYLEITLGDLQTALRTALPDVNTGITIKAKVGNSTFRNGNWRNVGGFVWDVAKMYRIEVPADCEITLTGDPINPADHEITILAGEATWIGFPFSESMDPADVIPAGFAVNGDQIKGKEGNFRYTNRWRPTGINALEPGKGYMYVPAQTVTEDRILIFPTNAK